MTDAGFDNVLIFGHGRSGTNWLMDLFDISPHTHCRKEPHMIERGFLSQLPEAWHREPDEQAMQRGWVAAMRLSTTHMGERDHPGTGWKLHYYAFPRWLGLYTAVRGRTRRRMLAKVLPSLRQPEWPLPTWLGSRRALEAALPVVNLPQSPIWAAWVLKHRPRSAVLHIVRHPGGFLNSWRNRYLKKEDLAEVLRLNRQRLHEIVAADATWADRIGDIDRMDESESELWYWCFAAERIHRAGEGLPAYRRIVYEQLTAEPLQVTEQCYAFTGLPWNDDIRKAVAAASRTSESIAANWRTRLTDEQIALVERILAGSLMRDWWTRDGQAA